MESILTSIKKLLGLPEDYTQFDQDIIMHINAAFMVLNQLGVGPEKCFVIEDDTSEWEDFLDDDQSIEAVKTYVFLKVRIVFDPPASATVMQSIKDAISEYEFRLSVSVDPGTN